MLQLCFAGKIVATEHIVRESREEVLCGSSIALTKVRFLFLIWLGRCASGSLSPSGRDDLHMWDRWIRLHFRRSTEIGGIPRPMRRQSIARRRRIRGISTAFHHVREQRPRCCDASMHATLSSRCLAVHGKDPRLFRCIHQRRTQLLVRVNKGCGAGRIEREKNCVVACCWPFTVTYRCCHAGWFASWYDGRGIAWAPATGKAMAELILHGRSECVDLDPFDPARFTPTADRGTRGRKRRGENVGEQW